MHCNLFLKIKILMIISEDEEVDRYSKDMIKKIYF